MKKRTKNAKSAKKKRASKNGVDPALLDRLVQAAKAVRERAYAPYSKYKVGAAIATKKGTVFIGCNVENASFGLTICAERVALQTAVAEGERAFEAVAIDAGQAAPTPPCGACRQVLAEFGVDLRVLLAADPPVVLRLGDLLPRSFGPGDLPPPAEARP
ncbi:MAG: cytidine deaminase [Planctomycetota bacterium]|nr:cytidine deaminase [Planctomycetota bacterium]